MKRLYSFILTALLIPMLALAQQVSFSVSVPPRVHQGDKFPITFRLKNAQGSSLRVPDIDGCTKLFGPSTATSHSTQIINGQARSSMTCDYTYYYRADRAGTITVGEASISAGGKTLHTSPTTFTVVASQGGAASGQGGAAGSQQSGSVDIDDIDTMSADRSVNASDVFVRIILSKSSAYEQEAVECEIKLYTKYGINTFVPTQQPAFDNFLVEDIDVTSQINIEELYNGERYMTALLKKCILFPQVPGKLTINSGNYDVTIIQYENINMGLFSVRQPRERKIKISSNTSSLNVIALPEPKPAGFEGAVGRFTAESRLIGSNFKSGDPASLIFTINGTGNIKYLKEPTVNFPSQFEAYTPTANVNASVSGSNVTGTMTIDYTFVPETPGDFTIPAVPFAYFDPATKSYQTIETQPFHLKVAKGANAPSSAAADQTDISAQNKDIRYIATNYGHLSMKHTAVVTTFWFWLIIAAMLFGFIAVIVITRHHINKHSDLTSLRLAGANKQAQRRLKAARVAMEKGRPEAFYDEMLRALWGYFSDKLAMPGSELSRDNIVQELSSHGISPEVCTQVVNLIDECEMAKYAPASSEEQLENVLKSGSDIIGQIERQKINKSRKQ